MGLGKKEEETPKYKPNPSYKYSTGCLDCPSSAWLNRVSHAAATAWEDKHKQMGHRSWSGLMMQD